MLESTEKYREEERKLQKEERKNVIIHCAKNLFLTNGYGKTNMAELAKQAHISRKTLYQYFSSKEEIAFEIEIQAFESFVDYQKKILKKICGNGYEQLSSYFQILIDGLDTHDDFIRLTGLFDYYFVEDYPVSEKDQRFMPLIEETSQPLIEMIHKGINDGSITPDLVAEEVAHTLSNAFLALAQRSISREKHLSYEHHMDPRKMIQIQCDLFLKALKNTSKENANENK
jgi:AcrR family transcriptional regulator